jgi:phage FluMu protein Com
MESQNITCEKCNKEVALASSELHKRRCEPKKLQTTASPISIVAQNFDAN